jgi:hypothetical protein
MKITLEDLRRSVAKRIINKTQLEDIVLVATQRKNADGDSMVVRVLYRICACIVIGMMLMFMISERDRLGGVGILMLSFSYALIFGFTGTLVQKKLKLRFSGSLLITLAVFMTPVVVYGIERVLGLWPMDNPEKYQGFNIWINGSWLMIELATIGTGCIAIALVRFPLISVPVACALWYMSQDLVPLFFGKNDFSSKGILIVSAVVGFLMIIFSYIIDRRTKEDYSFWGYLFGLIAFWGALSAMDLGGVAMKAVYGAINVVLIITAIWIGRRVFLVFGGFGIFGYVSYLMFYVFRDSPFFPLALGFPALVFIGVIIVYLMYENRISQWFNAVIPAFLRRYRPVNRSPVK